MPGPVSRRQPGATEEAAIYLRLITNQEPTLAACLLVEVVLVTQTSLVFGAEF